MLVQGPIGLEGREEGKKHTQTPLDQSADTLSRNEPSSKRHAMWARSLMACARSQSVQSGDLQPGC